MQKPLVVLFFIINLAKAFGKHINSNRFAELANDSNRSAELAIDLFFL